MTTHSVGGGESAAGRLNFATPAAAAVMVGAATLLLMGVGIPSSLAAHQLGSDLSQLPLILPFALVGVIIARRQPSNPIGWIMLAIAAVYTIGTDSGSYAVYAFRLDHPGVPMARLAVALTQCWIVLPMLLPLPILLFPDGRLPTRRLRISLWAYISVCVILVVGTATKDAAAFTDQTVHVDSSGELTTFSGSSGGLSEAIGLVGFLILAVISLSWVIHQVVAYRHAIGERRQQLKWLISGGAIAIIGFAFALFFGSASSPILRALSLGFLGVVAVPVSIGVGVLKYRLYEIDRIISRTTSYVIVTGLLLATYVSIVTLASAVLPRSSSLIVAAATLTAAAIARPLLRRVQDAVDRRFNRARYDAVGTVEAFGSRLRNQVDPNQVSEELERVVNTALEPQMMTIWLRQPD